MRLDDTTKRGSDGTGSPQKGGLFANDDSSSPIDRLVKQSQAGRKNTALQSDSQLPVTARAQVRNGFTSLQQTVNSRPQSAYVGGKRKSGMAGSLLDKLPIDAQQALSRARSGNIQSSFGNKSGANVNWNALGHAKQNLASKQSSAGIKPGAFGSGGAGKLQKGIGGSKGMGAGKGGLGDKLGGNMAGSGLDQEKLQESVQKIASGDIWGGIKEGVQTASAPALEKLYDTCLRMLGQTACLTFLGMEAIVYGAMIAGVKLTWWKRWLVHGVNLLIIAVIAAIIFVLLVIFMYMFQTFCQASGLDTNSWWSKIGGSIVGFAVDTYNGDTSGTWFVGMCQMVGTQ